MRLYLVYSFAQASPFPPSELGYYWVMISADDVASYGVWRAVEVLRRVESPPRGWLLVDSGGYRRISRGRLPPARRVLEVQEVLAGEVGGYPVLLDVPVRRPLRASLGDCKASNEATARQAGLWQRAFGDGYLYPIHVCGRESLGHALGLLKRVHPSVEAVGLGSLAPLAARRPSRVVGIVGAARDALADKWLHVFGVGNGLAAVLAHLALADSADTASHLVDARFGMARNPRDMSMAVVAPRRVRGRPRAEAREVAALCRCPACSTRPESLGAWGREGLLARAVHNAYWLLRAVAEPETAGRMVSRRPGLAGLFPRESRSTLCIVSCGARKAPGPAPAALLYTGRYFRLTARLAMEVCGSQWLILSARHGIVHPQDYLEPYDEKLGRRGSLERLAGLAAGQAAERGLDRYSRIIVLAGRAYAEAAARALPGAAHPCGDGWGVRVGRLLGTLSRHLGGDGRRLGLPPGDAVKALCG